MTEENRIVKLSTGEEVYIRDPSLESRRKAESEATKVYNQALEDGVKTRFQMIMLLKKRGIWSEEQDAEEATIRNDMQKLEEILDNGGIELEEAKKHAISIFQMRNKLQLMLADKIQYLNETVEAKKRSTFLDYLVYACTVYNNMRTKNYYKSYEDFLNKKDTEDAELIQIKCSEIIYGLPDLDDTPEKQFLREYGFVDDQMRLINEDGHLVDIDGRLIDENNNYIKYVGRGENKKAVIVDINGDEIKENKRKPFLDKNGKPVKPKNKENKTISVDS